MNSARLLPVSGLVIATFACARPASAQLPEKDAGIAECAGAGCPSSAGNTRSVAAKRRGCFAGRGAGARRRVTETRIENRGSKIEDRGWRSSILDLQSSILNLWLCGKRIRPTRNFSLITRKTLVEVQKETPPCATAREEPSRAPQSQPAKPEWQYGGFLDLGYLLDFNHPANRLFRSRGTAWHVDDLHLNIAGAYVKKKASELSRWGAELVVHGGKDSEVFGFSATAPNIDGYKWMRHLGLANVSYLAPAGHGITLQGGIFSSLIGYDSLYAKDNFTYTRPWGADFTPYLMMGVNASYPFNEKLTGTLFVLNGYWHLANANSVPSSGGQLAYKASPRVTVKETVLWGPHQSNTSFKYWRFLSDSLVERKGDRVTLAFEYIYSSERVVAPGSPRALMMAGQLPVHWALNKRWGATVRPEFIWDRDGRWTLARQTVKAITTTLEYRIPYQHTNTILRLEHRYDDSRGPDGGFFKGAEVPGVAGLTSTQHLLIFGLIVTFDSTFRW